MQVEFLEVTKEMALRNEDKLWVQEQIRGAIHPQGWKKALHWLREWGLVGVVIMAFLALAGIVTTLAIFTSNRLEQNARFQQETKDFMGNTEGRLKNIDDTLKTIEKLVTSQSPDKTFKSLIGLDQKSFDKTLSVFRKVLEQSPAEVKATAPQLQEVANKLRNTDQRIPEYWSTVLQFISFATAGLTPNVPPPGPPQTIISRVYSNGPQSIRWPTFKNTVVLLDGGELWNARFENCRIVFTQSPVRMHNLTFIDCVFEMPVTDTPSPYLKSASQLLLASDLSSVKIPSL